MAAGVAVAGWAIRWPTKKELGELVGEYLREALATLAAQAILFRDPDWLKGQGAADVAVLHGVLCDKAIRILAALEPAD